VAAELAFHAHRHLLEIEVSDPVSVYIVDLLEFVQIDVDQPEDAGIVARVFNQLVEKRL
jgi:hypothetical protein